MNTTNLNRRLKGYTRTKLRASNEDSTVVDVIDDLQSITDEDDHSVDTGHDTTDVVDAEYRPNPAIVTEMMTEINEEAPITNQDTALKLLSDSNEALRRLDIISMNVNYPISGYRSSSTTILKAEPGLESLLSTTPMRKRQLNQALENAKLQLIKGAFKAFIKWLQGKLDGGIAKLRSLFKNKPSAVTADDIKIVAAASNSSETVTVPQQTAIGYSPVEPIPERVRKTNQTKNTTDNSVIEMGTEVEQVPLKVFTRSKYEKDIWHNLGHWGRHMIINPEKTLTMIAVINELATDVGGFLNATTVLYASVSSNEEDTERLVTNFKRDNNKFLIALNDYVAIQREFLRNDTSQAPAMSGFLSNAQLILKQEKTLSIDKFIATNRQSNDIYKAMNTLASNMGSVENRAKKAALDEVKNILISVSALYGTLPYTTDSMNRINSTISKLAADVNSVKLAK